MTSLQHQARINDLLHRLQSLDVDLQEAMRAQDISESDYSERLDRLRNALGHANKIKALMVPSKIENNPISQVDLPVMADYSRMEQRIVSKFVADMKKKVDDVTAVSKRTTDWTKQAAVQSTGWMIAIWRLSWLRRQLIKVEHELSNVRKSRDVVEDFIARAEIGKASDAKIISQRDLMSAFNEFEQATEKVTSLRARVRSETSKNESMRSWLKSLEIERRSQNPEKPAPELYEVEKVTLEFSDQLTGAARIASDRLVVARQVLKEIKKIQHQNEFVQNAQAEGMTHNTDVGSTPSAAAVNSMGKKKTKKRYRGNRL